MELEDSNTFFKRKEIMLLNNVTNLIIKEIEFIKNIEKKILEEQKKSWLEFSTKIPKIIKKEIPPIIMEKTGYRVKWLNSSCLEINFFLEDELEKIRNINLQQKQPLKKKKRETIPKPSSFSEEKNYRRKSFDSSNPKKNNIQ